MRLDIGIALALLLMLGIAARPWATNEVQATGSASAGRNPVIPSMKTPALATRPQASGQDAAGSVITGRIVDASANPARDVLIAAHAETSWIHDRGGKPLVQTQTDRLGRFSLITPGDTSLRVVASHDHFQPVTVASAVPAARGMDHDLGEVSITSALCLTVEVRGPHGQRPVAGAEARLTEDTSRTELSGFAPTTKTRLATSGADGIAVFYGEPPGRAALHLVSQGHASQTIRGLPDLPANQPLRVRLQPGSSLAGVVVDRKGEGVAGALVACTAHGSLRRHSTRTLSDGSFLLPGLAKVPHQVLIESLQHGSARRDRWVPDGARQTIRLSQGPAIHGEVLAAGTRRPIEGAAVTLRVQAKGPSLRSDRVYRPTTRTDRDGRFRFPDVPEGILLLTAASSLHTRSHLKLASPPQGRVTLTLEDRFRIRGRVLNPAGKPLVDAVIQIANNQHSVLSLSGLADHVVPGKRPLPRARSGRDGRFELLVPAAGRYSLIVQSPGLPALATAPFDAIAGQRQDLGGIYLKLGGRVEGYARLAGGEPAQGAVVHLEPLDHLPASIASSKVRCESNGYFSIPKIPPGHYRVSYDYPDRDTDAVAAACRADTTVRIQVRDGHTLRQDLKSHLR